MMSVADCVAVAGLALQLGIGLGALLVLPTLRRVMREIDDVRQQRDDARTDAWRWRKRALGLDRGPYVGEGGGDSA